MQASYICKLLWRLYNSSHTVVNRYTVRLAKPDTQQLQEQIELCGVRL